MLDLDDLAKLEKLHSDAIPESTHLEYKASPAIQSTEKAREEISKDISAMANADGGLMIPMISPGCTDLISPRIPR
jgi:hypothetical protein